MKLAEVTKLSALCYVMAITDAQLQECSYDHGYFRKVLSQMRVVILKRGELRCSEPPNLWVAGHCYFL